MADNNPECFPNLSELHLKSFAHQIVKRFSDIPIIEVSLYHYANVFFPGKGMPIKYAMAFRVDGSVDSKVLEAFHVTLGGRSTIRDNMTFHELSGGRPFSTFYRSGVAPDDYLMQWRFLSFMDGGEVPEGVLTDDPGWILYLDEQHNLETFIQKVKPEIELLYGVIKEEVGFSGNNPNAVPETWMHTSLGYFDAHKNNFCHMLRSALEDREVFSARDGKHSEDIKSRILQGAVESYGLGKMSPSRLWKIYRKTRPV